MKMVKILNKSTNEVILDKAYIAATFLERLRGLIGKKSLEQGEALVIKPCSSVHSFHMKFLFDVAFIDKNNKAIHIIHSMRPWKTSTVVKNSEFVIETSGDYFKNKLKVDDEIEII